MKYLCLCSVYLNDELHKPGVELELNGQQAEHFLSQNAVINAGKGNLAEEKPTVAKEKPASSK